jgi:phytoene dehydrogenase-like protein
MASPVLRDLQLHGYGLQWRHAPEVLAHILPDDRCVLLSRDIDRTAASVDSFAPGDGDAWRRMFEVWQRFGPTMMDALLRPFPPVRPGLRIARGLGPVGMLRGGRYALMTVRRLSTELFRGEGAPLLLAGNALHTDLGTDSAGSAGFGFVLAMLGQDVGFPVPAGGAARIIDALVNRLRSRGGTLICGDPVARVLVRDGRAAGVRLGSGEEIAARRAVLADVPAPALFLNLVGAEHLPARFVADLSAFQWDNATVKVDWALSGRIPWIAEAARTAGTVHLAGDLNGLTRYSSDLVIGKVPEDPFLLLGQMTTADPDRSPPGTESVWAYTHVPQGLPWDADSVRRHADRMQAVIERHAPGFGDLVVGRAVHGPMDLQRLDGNLVEGAINGGTAAVYQMFVYRPVPGLGRADTPVDGLFLAGASAHPGGGVHGACGANAARAALARNGRAGALYGAAIGLAQRQIYAR